MLLMLMFEHGLNEVWKGQLRHLGVNGNYDTRADSVTSGLPQGDPMSALGLAVCLAKCVREIQKEYPQVHQAVFVDDRFLLARATADLLAVGNKWDAVCVASDFKNKKGKTQ